MDVSDFQGQFTRRKSAIACTFCEFLKHRIGMCHPPHRSVVLSVREGMIRMVVVQVMKCSQAMV